MRLPALVALLLVATSLEAIIAAQDRAPAPVASESLATRTRAALAELATLEASAEADRDALEASAGDLDRAIEEIGKPLPPLPTRLDQTERFDAEYLREQIEAAKAFLAAWESRQSRYGRASDLLGQLEDLKRTVREAHERLLNRVAALRPLLIEAQRRIGRRELDVKELGIEEGAPSVSDWIAKSAELAEKRGELLRGIDDIFDRLETARRRFEGLPPFHPEEARSARRIEISLATLAEAGAVADEQRARLAQIPPETVPSEVVRAVDEWKSRGTALETAAEGVPAAREALLAVKKEQEALQAPRREDVPAGEGLKEVRDARQDVGLATSMIGFYEKTLELVDKANTRSAALLEAIATASKGHTEYTRQTARLMASLESARELSRQRTLKDWTPPPDTTEQIVWNEWRHRQTDELDRLELAEAIRSEVVSAEEIDAKRATLEKERESLKRAQAQLETELSYAESVTRMEGQSDEELLALVAPDGEIARNLEALAKAKAAEETRIADTAAKCFKVVSAIQSLENPYSQAVLRQSSDKLAKIKDALAALPEGKPLDEEADRSEVERQNPSKLPTLLSDQSKSLSAAEIAKKESEYLASEQQFAHFVKDYYVSLDKLLVELRQQVAERRELDSQHEARLDELIRERKRRYAAARELRRRVDQGRLDGSRLPKELSTWLERASILEASQELRAVRRASSTFHERAGYEISRLETLTAAREWMQIRTDAADARVRFVGRPVALLTSALTTVAELDDVDRKNLQYEARAAESKDERTLEGLLERFTDAEERERFQDPLATYYLELANTLRVEKDLKLAETAYNHMAESCLKEKEQLEPLRDGFNATVALRELEYNAARYAAAVTVHPESRARLEEAFRAQYGRDLPYRLNLREGDLELAAELVFGAEARLRAERSIARDADLLLSKVGLEQEAGWYRSQIARIGTLLQVEKSRQEDLGQRIGTLRETYYDLLQSNALRGLSVTLVIPVIALLLVRVLRRVSRRFEDRVMLKQGEDLSDRQRRLKTVSKTSTAAIAVLVWTIAIVYVFARLGLDITPIVASASVVGLAVAFGAQTLIKDFFSGFFILLENQFTIGDVVTLGTITGTVENISLRITVLRDLKGVVHYIPNGSIGQVSNLTQGWSRVVMEISVSYKEDPDHAAEVLGDVLLEMARDDAWRYDIIEDPVVAGVELLTERSVDIRVMIKTRPGKQWAVAREARRRIKRRFDEVGIEIPFPHRVVHHVYEGAEEPGAHRESAST